MTGQRDQYYPLEYAPKYQTTPPPGAAQRRVEFADVMRNWIAVECDLHQYFGVDVETGVLHDRTWRWFALRIADLLKNEHSRLGAAVRAQPV